MNRYLPLSGSLVLVLSLTSCGEPAPAETADEAVQRVVDGAKSGDFVPVWHAMPPKYRADMAKIAEALSTKIDDETFDAIMGTVRRASSVLESQKELLLQVAKGREFRDKEKGKRFFESATSLSKTVLGSSLLSSRSDFAAFDGETFLDEVGPAIWMFAKAAAAIEGMDLDAELKKVSISLVEGSGDTATVAAKVGERSNNALFQRVDGHWVPAEMAKDWDGAIKMVLEGIAKMPTLEGKAKTRLLGQLQMFGGILTQLEAVETKREAEELMEGLGRGLSGLLEGMPLFGGQRTMAVVTLAQTQAREIYSLGMMHMSRRRRVPESIQDFIEDPDLEFDPWGGEFLIEHKGRRDFVVISAGPDGEFDTEDDIRFSGSGPTSRPSGR